MSYSPRLTPGQALMAASAPVVLASDQSAVPHQGAIQSQAFSLTAAGAGTAYDVGVYAWVSVQMTALYVGQSSLSFQTSNDNTNWLGCTLVASNTFQGAGSSSSGVTGVLYHGPISGRYFRVFGNGAYTSGTGTGTIVFSTTPRTLQSMAVAAVPGVGSDSAVISSTAAMLQAASDGALQRVIRTPGQPKTVTATASGDTALWTPTSGKKFRLMRYKIGVTADAAISGGGDLDIVLRDATTAIGAGESVYCPSTAGTVFGAFNGGLVEIGNGFLSAAANNVLNVNLSAALTSGKVRVVCAGTEE